jgi:hopene-associated glycosyltransferase HpnB
MISFGPKNSSSARAPQGITPGLVNFGRPMASTARPGKAVDAIRPHHPSAIASSQIAITRSALFGRDLFRKPGSTCRDHALVRSGMIASVLAALSLAVWIYLVFARGRFWLGRERDDAPVVPPAVLAPVAIVVPARNEAENVGASVTSLLRQDYPAFSLVLVDDDSNDGTAEVARRTAAALQAEQKLTVIAGEPLPAQWTGKLWALRQGIAVAEAKFAPKYLMLTDADIVHAPDTLSWLVAHAETYQLVLASLTARWRCERLPERVHIPAFIFFFQMLYPFAWVNRPEHPMAGAAGGCMLIRADALRAAGGIAVIRDALIDDCALAAELKQHGPIWLGLTNRVRSIRTYASWGDIRRMVARSAYAQLNYSPLMLAGTMAGLTLTYLVPPVLALAATGSAQLLGFAAWALMAMSFQPTLRFYRLSPLWGVALPAISFLFMLYTLDSAYQYAAGKGGSWKGRVQAKGSQ